MNLTCVICGVMFQSRYSRTLTCSSKCHCHRIIERNKASRRTRRARENAYRKARRKHRLNQRVEGQDMNRIIPHGKYKGRNGSEIRASDSTYFAWLVGQPWWTDPSISPKDRLITGRTWTRVCIKCGKEFKANAPHNTVCSPECRKAHKRETQTKYVDAHREYIAERRRVYRQTNREEIRAGLIKWQTANRERIKAYRNEYRPISRANHQETVLFSAALKELGVAPNMSRNQALILSRQIMKQFPRVLPAIKPEGERPHDHE